jgi:hypothetical protein
LRYDALKQRLTWKLRRTDELGVRRYPFAADGLLDLRVEARSSVTERPRVTLSSNQPLEVELLWPGGSEIVRVGSLL